MKLTVSNLKELPQAAEAILEFAGAERLFLFFGEMGSGKTTLIKEMCRLLEVEDTISSPTFSLVNEYTGRQGVIYHFDFYRIKSATEAFDIGYEDYLYSGNYCFIEWPEKISGLLPERFVEVALQETSVNGRLISLRNVN